jgi:hypothetical protein
LTEAGDLLLAPFRTALARLCPDAFHDDPRGTALDGALALPAVPETIFGALVASAQGPRA